MYKVKNIKNKFIQIVIITVVVNLTGCFSFTEPKNNNDFGKIIKISDLNGIYLNKGDTGNERKIYLSYIIWNNDKFLKQKHKLIDSIVVKALNQTQLRIQAIQNQSVIKEQIFVKNKDFNIDSSGRINLKSEFEVVNHIALGVGYQRTTLGVDILGNIKHVTSSSFIGTVIVIMPFVYHGTEDVRFLKIKNN